MPRHPLKGSTKVPNILRQPSPWIPDPVHSDHEVQNGPNFVPKHPEKNITEYHIFLLKIFSIILKKISNCYEKVFESEFETKKGWS